MERRWGCWCLMGFSCAAANTVVVAAAAACFKVCMACC